MPAGSRHLQASPYLTLEFTTTPTNYLCEPVSEIMFQLPLLCIEDPVMSCYWKLRYESINLTAIETHMIRTPIDHRTPTSYICSLQAHYVAKIMLLCDFLPVGIICCLGGVYTSDFLDFASIDACLLAISDISVDPGEPPYNFPALKHLFH